MKSLVRHSLAAAAATLLTLTPLQAQDFTWTEATTMKLGNVPGVIAKLMGSGKEVLQTNYLSGHRMRVEQQYTATITDADEGRFTMLNTKDRTYWTMTFKEMSEQMDAAVRDAKKEPAEAGPQIKFSVKVEPTGERATVAGLDASRTFITILAEAAPDEKEQTPGGTMAFVVDTWNAKGAPHAGAMKEFQEALVKQYGRDLGGSMAAMQALFAQYEGMEDGWSSAMRELRKAEGVPVKTTIYVATVPYGMKLDRDALLNPKEQPKESTGKKIGGMLGRMAGAPAKQEEAKPQTQALILSSTTELREVKQGGPGADAFTVPAGYKEKKPKQ